MSEEKKRQRIIKGDCVQIMQKFPDASVNLIVTDPPYLCNYKDRNGRKIANDTGDGAWLNPAYREMFRVLKPDSFCISFYGWTKLKLFVDAWAASGFQIAGHIAFTKRYSASKKYLRYQHENAYLLIKGYPPIPEDPMGDVVDWIYSKNRLHPTQKPVQNLEQIVDNFSKPGDVVLDPFCGSGSTCVAAKKLGRKYWGIELDDQFHSIAEKRMEDYQVIFTN